MVFATSAGAVDQCDPGRKFCGRLLLLICGAGSEPTEEVPNNITGVKLDNASEFTQATYLQLRKTQADGLPVYTIIMSSDPALRASFNKLPLSMTKHSGLLGIIPTTIESFERLLTKDSGVSLFERALSKFADAPTCIAQLLTESSSSLNDAERAALVLSHLKVEIAIMTHNAGGGIPAWQHDDQNGTRDDWQKLDKLPKIELALLEKLKFRLGDAVVHTFVTACFGDKLGEALTNADQCSSYLSATSWAKLVTKDTPPLAFALPKQGRELQGRASSSPGSPNVMIMGVGLYLNALMPKNAEDADREFHNVNPLCSFTTDSTDSTVQRILALLTEVHVDEEKAKKLASAGFKKDVPFTTLPSSDRKDARLEAIFGATAKLRAAYAANTYRTTATTDGPGGDIIEALRPLGSCMDYKNPQPGACKSLSALLDLVSKGSPPGGQQSQFDANLIKEANALSHASGNRRELLNTLDAYRKGDITLSVMSAEMQKLVKTYSDFSEHLQIYCYRKRRSTPDGAMSLMDASIAKTYFAFLRQLYPLLLNEALQVKCDRIDETAKLLVLHRTELRTMDVDKELRQLSQQLSCLMNYPVGPAFDKRYSSPKVARAAR